MIEVDRWWMKWSTGDKPAVGVATAMGEVFELPLAPADAYLLVESRRPSRRDFLAQHIREFAPDGSRVELRRSAGGTLEAAIVCVEERDAPDRPIPFALGLAAATVLNLPLLAQSILIRDLQVQDRNAELHAFSRFIDSVCAEDFRIFELGKFR